MNLKIAAVAAALVGAAFAVPAQAAVPGTYQATFTYPDGSIQNQCFTLMQTDSYPGYSSSGTWVDTTTSGVSGTYVVYKKQIHLAGNYGPANFITIDGTFNGTGGLVNPTFDIFSPTGGAFFAAGYFTYARNGTCP